jgi:hypothetical protein
VCFAFLIYKEKKRFDRKSENAKRKEPEPKTKVEKSQKADKE